MHEFRTFQNICLMRVLTLQDGTFGMQRPLNRRGGRTECIVWYVCTMSCSYRSNNSSTLGAPRPCPLLAFASASVQSVRSAPTCRRVGRRRSIELDFNVVLACFGRPFSTLLRFSSASTHPFPRLRRVRLRSHDHCEISQST